MLTTLSGIMLDIMIYTKIISSQINKWLTLTWVKMGGYKHRVNCSSHVGKIWISFYSIFRAKRWFWVDALPRQCLSWPLNWRALWQRCPLTAPRGDAAAAAAQEKVLLLPSSVCSGKYKPWMLSSFVTLKLQLSRKLHSIKKWFSEVFN